MGILVLFSTSIFSCKHRKAGKKEANTPSLFKIPVLKDSGSVNIPVADLYVRSCGVCHQAYEKDAYSKTSWGFILDSMQQRAHISNQNKADIYYFLTGDSLKLDLNRMPEHHPHKH